MNKLSNAVAGLSVVSALFVSSVAQAGSPDSSQGDEMPPPQELAEAFKKARENLGLAIREANGYKNQIDDLCGEVGDVLAAIKANSLKAEVRGVGFGSECYVSQGNNDVTSFSIYSFPGDGRITSEILAGTVASNLEIQTALSDKDLCNIDAVADGYTLPLPECQ